VPFFGPNPINPTASSRELYFLRLQAETLRVELDLENQLRLQGIATLPLEWTTYLELQRQVILDKVQRIEARGDDFTSLDDPCPAHTPPSIQGNTIFSVQPFRVHPYIHPENEGTLAFTLIW
jgi:hypothetical protein